MTDDSRARRGVRGLILLALAAPLVRATGIMFPSVVPKAFYLQALTAVALAILAVAWASDGRVGPMGRPAPSRDPFLWALLAFVVLSALSAALGASPSRGLLGTVERRWGVLTWASFAGFYLLLRSYLDDDGWRRALQVTVAVATAVALYGLLRAAGLWPGQQEAAGWARIGSTLGNPGYLGAYMTLGVALTGYLAVRSRGVGRRMVWAAAGLVQTAALLGSGTRAPVLGMAVAAGVLAAVWLVSGAGAKRRRAAAAAVAIAVVGGGLALVATADGDPYVASWWDRLLTTASPETRSARFRLIAWAATVREVGVSPLLGAGPETFEQVWSRHFDPVIYHVNASPVLDRAHNVLVHVAATTGLLGLLAYLGMWAALGRGIVRAWRREALSGPAASALAFGAIAYFVYLLFWFEDHSSFLLFVVLAGVAGHLAAGGEPPGATARAGAEASGSGSPGREDDGRGREPAEPAGPTAGADSTSGGGEDGGRRASSRLPASARFGVPALLLALAALLVWHNVRVLDAARDTWDGEYSMDAWEGAERYQQALEAGLPGSEPVLQAYLRRLTFLVGHGDSGSPEGPTPRMERALAAAERAVDGWEAREPDNPWVHVRRSRLCALREDVYRDGRGKSCARRELERAVELSPRRIRYRHWLADHHLSAGEPGRALEVLDGALRVYGSFGETYFYRARVHWATGEREAAVRQSRLATSLGWGGQPSPFVQELAGWLAEEGRPAEAAELVQDHLELRYAKLRRPDLATEPGQGFRPWDRALAGRLPVLHLRAGDTEAAVRTAEFVSHRLAVDGDVGRRRRVERFIEDVRAGRPGRWTDAASVVEVDRPDDRREGSRPAPTGPPGEGPPGDGRSP